MRLDRRDVRMLAILQHEGRITNQRLAERVHLSPSACLERLRRLESTGLVRGYHAEVDLAPLLSLVRVHVEVTLARHRAPDFERFEAAVREVPEILACDAIGGGIDYVMTVVATDIADYQRLIDELLAMDLGIERYFSYVVTKPVKRPSGLPVARLLARAGLLER